MDKLNSLIKQHTTDRLTAAEQAQQQMRELCNITDFTLSTENSYLEFFSSWLPKVRNILNLLDRNQHNSRGLEMTREFYHSVQADIGAKVSEAASQTSKRVRDEEEARTLRYMFGGDVELHAFYKELTNFDWWYNYSDDSSVWNAGERRYAALVEKAKAKGEKYEKLLNHVAASVSRTN